MLKYTRLLVLLMFALLLSCAGSQTYVNDEADFGFYTRVGVIPLANLTGDRNASDKVTSTLVTELLMLKSIEVANMGDLTAALKTVVKQDMANVMEELSSEQARAIGEQAGLEGIFVGAVKDFSMVRSGQNEFPLVAVIIRFVDCQSGRVVWSYETSRKGGPKFPIFSFGETHTLGEMTTKVCRDVAGSFGKASR